MRIVLTALVMGHAISSGATGIAAVPSDTHVNATKAREETTVTADHNSPCWFTRQSGLESHYMNLRLCRQAEAARGMVMPQQESSAPPAPGTQPS